MDYYSIANKCAMVVETKPPPTRWGIKELLKEVQHCLQCCIDVNGAVKEFRPYQVSALLALESQLKDKEQELLDLLEKMDNHE